LEISVQIHTTFKKGIVFMTIRRAIKVGIGVLLLATGAALWMWWEQGASRRQALDALAKFHQSLLSPDPAPLLNAVFMPVAIVNRTASEQAEFLRKALRDEISPEGLVALQRHGAFGPLTKLFPAEAARWASQAGVKPEDCVAFRLDRTNGFRAEVVLARQSAVRNPQSAFPYRVLRCNNVR
jgi:hypothetical protein